MGMPRGILTKLCKKNKNKIKILSNRAVRRKNWTWKERRKGPTESDSVWLARHRLLLFSLNGRAGSLDIYHSWLSACRPPTRGTRAWFGRQRETTILIVLQWGPSEGFGRRELPSATGQMHLIVSWKYYNLRSLWKLGIPLYLIPSFLNTWSCFISLTLMMMRKLNNRYYYIVERRPHF